MTGYGIQMYSLRDITKNDLDGALAKVAAIGYESVEFAGFFGHDAKDVKAMLERHGLRVSGTHTGWEELAKSYADTVAYHKEIGNKNIIIPGADLSTKEKLDNFIVFLNETAPKLKKDGITLGYHNHYKEFITTEYGQIIHTELQNRTDIDFEIDTYWAFIAGEDPTKLLEKLKDRVHVIHLKDGDRQKHGCALGEGEAPVPAVIDKAKELGMYMVVESEGLNPTGEGEVTRCFEYLRKLGK